MRQYDICANSDPATKARTPYLIVLQSDLLSIISTAVVAPVRKGKLESHVTRLNPLLTIDGEIHTIVMQEMSAIHRRRIGRAKANAAEKHTEFVAAIDLIFTGV